MIRLTMRQFNILIREIERHEAGRVISEAQILRISAHGDRPAFERLVGPFRRALTLLQPKAAKGQTEKANDNVTTDNAEDFGLTVGK